MRLFRCSSAKRRSTSCSTCWSSPGKLAFQSFSVVFHSGVMHANGANGKMMFVLSQINITRHASHYNTPILHLLTPVQVHNTNNTQKLLHFFPSIICSNKMSPPQDSESLQEMLINTISYRGAVFSFNFKIKSNIFFGKLCFPAPNDHFS